MRHRLLVVATLAATLITSAPAVAQEGIDAPDRQAVLDQALRAVVGEGFPTADGTCPVVDVTPVYDPIPSDDIEAGGYSEPLVEPDPATGTRATGIATCDGDPRVVLGFDADWDDARQDWEVFLHPIDLTHVEGEAHLHAVEQGLDHDHSSTARATTKGDDGEQLRAATSASTSTDTVPSWPSGISQDPPPLSSSDPQDTCSPTIKPGTAALRDLLIATYPSQDRWSITRACNIGGRSEHKEGRALDWYVDAYDAGERAIGDRLTRWLVEDDPWGNAYGPARHLGVMYVIWNRQSWYQFRADDGWRNYTGASPHTDHIHFSLTWPGARCEATWWVATDCDGTSSGATDRVDRVAGDDRIDTGIALSQEAFDRADTVVVASAADFPDALAASSLAAAVDGPLLLTSPSALSGGIADEVRRLRAGSAYVVGGTAAIKAAVVQELRDDVTVTRLAGADRIETAARIARQVEALTDSKRVLVVRSDSFPDALSAANIAGATGAPILLTRRATLPRVTRDTIRDLDPDKGWVLGGTAAITDATWTTVRSTVGGVVHRVAGTDRYATALQAAETARRNGMAIDPTMLASGADYPDALAAGPVAAALDGQLLLVEPNRPSRNQPLLDALAAESSTIDRALIAGGSAAVSTSIDDAVLEAIQE